MSRAPSIAAAERHGLVANQTNSHRRRRAPPPPPIRPPCPCSPSHRRSFPAEASTKLANDLERARADLEAARAKRAELAAAVEAAKAGKEDSVRYVCSCALFCGLHCGVGGIRPAASLRQLTLSFEIRNSKRRRRTAPSSPPRRGTCRSS